jgi:hypothetical protein
MVQEPLVEATQEVGVAHRLIVLLDQEVAVSRVDQGVEATKVAQGEVVLAAQGLLEVFLVKMMALPHRRHVMV